MKDVSIAPLDFVNRQIVEIEEKINGKKKQHNFRAESFRWEPVGGIWDVGSKIKMPQDGSEKYEESWQLIQIFRPTGDSKFIEVLYRQRQPAPSVDEGSSTAGK